MTTMVMTTISSTNVKPNALALLPLRIGFSIRRLLIRLAVHGKHILSAPTGGFGIVLIAAQTPFGFAGEGIAWNLAQQLDLLSVGTVRELDSLHQDLQSLRPTVRPGL